MTLPQDLRAPDPSPFWVRMAALKPALVAIGDVLIQKRADGGWEPAFSVTTVSDVIGQICDSADTQDWVEVTFNSWRKLGAYTTTVRLWSEWVGKLATADGHDLVCLLAVRELLSSYAAATWSVSDGAGHTNNSSVGVTTGGSGGGGTSFANNTTITQLASSDLQKNAIGVVGANIHTSRSGSASVNAGGGTGRHNSTVKTDAAGGSWNLGAYLVPSLHVLDLLILSESATVPLPTVAVMDLLARGLITTDDAKLRVQSNGDLWEDQLRHLQATAPQPTAEQWIEWGLRQGLGQDRIDQLLRGAGMVDPDYRDALKLLHFRTLAPAEIIRLMTGHTEDGDLAARYQLDAGSDPASLAPYLHALQAEGVSADLFRQLWRAHWDQGGIGRATEALQRLNREDIAPDVQFGEQAFYEMMRMANVPEYWLPRLRALAVRPVGFRQINQLVSVGQLNQVQAIRKWQDLGFALADAQSLALAGQRQAAALAASQGHGFTAAEVVKLLTERAMTNEEADGWLRRLFLTDAEIATVHQRVEAERAGAERKQRLAAVETAFVHGAISELDVRDQLARQDFSATDTEYTLSTWKLRQQQHRHPVGESQLASWLKDGLLTGPQFINRLVMLGYDPQDAQATLAAITVQLNAARQKQLAAQQAKAAAAAQKAATALSRARSAAARAAAHLSRLKAQKVNAQQHAAFVEQLAALVQEAKDAIATETDKVQVKKANDALARTEKTRTAIEQEAERLRLLSS